MTIHPSNINDLDLKELSNALDILNQSKYKDYLGDIYGIINKIRNIIQVNQMEQLSGNYDFIEFEKIPESWGNNFLIPLIKAIRDKHVVEIYYQSFYEDKPYFNHVHPYLLKEYHNRWYLIGLNDQKNELRTYGLDRIWEIKLINKAYIPVNFNPKEYFKNTVGVISPTGTPPRIKIQVRKPQAQYLITQPLHWSQSIDFENDDMVIFTYSVHPTYEFKEMLLGMGSEVKVIEPISLREDIIKDLQLCLKNYEEKS